MPVTKNHLSSGDDGGDDDPDQDSMMNTALWIAEGLLVATFLATGTIKLTQPRAKMAAGPMRWAADVSDAQFRGVGSLEVLGALGLILAATAGAPLLTTLAATGLALTMIGAIVTHLRYGEPERIAVPAALLAVSVFVALAA
jgi:uncharacterized membrane protein YphA (DoxX/SURF4 family)